MLEEVQDAIQGAREAFPSWRPLPVPQRVAALFDTADVGRIGFVVATSQD